MGSIPRRVHNLVLALSPPDDGPPVVCSLTVPEPSANHIREAIASCGAHLKISGEISSKFVQAFQRVDEIAWNEPTPPVDDDYDTIPVVPQEFIDDLVAIAEGRKIVLLKDGDPVIMDAEEAASMDLSGYTGYAPGAVDPTKASPTSGGASQNSSDGKEHPDPVLGAALADREAFITGRKVATQNEDGTISVTETSDGSVSGEKSGFAKVDAMATEGENPATKN